jgi:demethylmenaquinone methyltransferase / 2-methoxy-6-polyprenyl-1,4-benzoquinol methylase
MVDKGPRQVRGMFASVAHRYDLLNRVLSLSIDRRWRKVARRRLLVGMPARPLILDLCTGTGDVALELAPSAVVLGCDFCAPMLERGVSKARRRGYSSRIFFVEADALALPLGPGGFDAVTVAFGLRNLEDFRHGLTEMFRVLRIGGRLAILEFSVPRVPLVRPLYLFYFSRILPRIGALVSGREGPYSYLPQSVREFPGSADLCRILAEVGFARPRAISLTLGIATLYLAEKLEGVEGA